METKVVTRQKDKIREILALCNKRAATTREGDIIGHKTNGDGPAFRPIQHGIR
jgi:hypothetical protein